jgi:3-phosphoshikimate 1-carboxyvinyltransferase
MDTMIVRNANSVSGSIVLPGDKSVSHRAAMLSAMAVGETRIGNFATSADCASTLECLRQLGVKIKRDGSTVKVEGVGKAGFQKPDAPLDCGNSGTTMRLLAGILAGQNFESILTGDESLQKRPMRRVVEPLTLMGATIGTQDGRAPITITGANPLAPIEYDLAIASAQIKSCVLLAGLNASGRTSVIERIPTRDHTERMLRWFGVQIEETEVADGVKLIVSGHAELAAKDLAVPGDISSAAFFIAVAACLPGSDLRLAGVGLNPSRTAVIDAMRGLGASIELENVRDDANEPIGDIRIRGRGSLGSSGSISGPVVANLIDEIPILAVVGTQADGGLEIRDASELRVKESDRISAVVENLRRMNASVEEFPDGFRVKRSKLIGAKIDSFNDHRIAMAFGIAGLFAEGETEIAGAECADVSFPGFFDVLADAAA